MPKLAGLIDFFPKLEEVSADKVVAWLDRHPSPKIIENKLGNELLYPQTVPCSVEDLEFKLALLREGLKLHLRDFYNSNLKVAYIPEGLLEILPDLSKLAWALIDVIQPIGITALVLKSPTLGTKNLGTIIRPETVGDSGEVNIWTGGRKYEVKVGDLAFIPVSSNKPDVRFQSSSVRLLGKEDITTEVTGGQLGIIVDVRRKQDAA